MITGIGACTQRIEQMTDQTDDDLTPSLPPVDGDPLTATAVDDSLPSDPDSKATAPAPSASRPNRAKRHLRVVASQGEQVEANTQTAQKGKAPTKGKRSAPDIQTGLTEKQSKFCDGIAAGLSLSDSYRAAYDTSNMTAKSVHELACRLMSDVKVASRLKAISEEKTQQLRMLASSDAAAAVEVFRRMMLSADTDATKVRAAELLAKASGVFTEKVEVTDKTDRSVSEIEQALKEKLARLGLTG